METTLLLYLAPIFLPIVADIFFDLLPVKYVGKLRKIGRHACLIQKNRGIEERNRWSANKFSEKLLDVKTMILSKAFDEVVVQFKENLTIFTSISEELVVQGVHPDILKEIVLTLQSQQASIDLIQAMYNKAVNGGSDV